MIPPKLKSAFLLLYVFLDNLKTPDKNLNFNKGTYGRNVAFMIKYKKRENGGVEMSVTFIHAADIHLDRPFLGLNSCPEPMAKRVRQSPFTALASLVNTAIARKVDFVLLAGDIFDSPARGLRAETHLKEYMRQLATHGIEVFIIHGNHDPLDGHWSGLSYGGNVHVFGPRPDVFHFKNVNIYGFSYPTQHVLDNMIDFYQKKPDSDFHVAMLHGSIKGSADHDVYAPFTISDLLNKKMDYWALGHIHKREVLHQDPPIIYPGSLQGLSVKETGAKGFYVVTLEKSQSHTEFVKTSDILWDEVKLDVSGFDTFDGLARAGEELKEQRRQTLQGVLLRIKLIGEFQHQQEIFTDLLEVLRTGEEDRQGFVWVTEIQDDTTPVFDREKLKASPQFMGDVVRLIDQKDSISDDIQALYQHHQAKRYLASLTEEEQAKMLKDAEKLLLTGLHKINGRR